MRYLLLLTFLFQAVIYAQTDTERTLKEKNIEAQLKKEKKFFQEQQFYKGKDYDLKSFEVNMESVKNLPDVEDTNADFNMDHTYD